MGLLDSEYPEWQKCLKNFSKNRWNGLQFSEYCLRWLGVRDRENQTKKLYFYWAIPGLFFFIFIFSMQLTVDKICRWLDCNCGYLVSEANALPTGATTTAPKAVKAKNILSFFISSANCDKKCLTLLFVRFG